MMVKPCPLYTEEINAAVRGAHSAGATEIVVMDCHGAGGPWSFNSLLPEMLHPACEYVVQEEWTEYLRKPSVELVGDRRVVSHADDWWTAWRQFFR